MRHAQKTELFTPVVAGLGHEKTGGAVMLRTAHSAQRTTHNAQRTTQNAERTASVCMGAAAMVSRQAQQRRGRDAPLRALQRLAEHGRGLGVVVVVVQPMCA
jgi:hypothetical protein